MRNILPIVNRPHKGKNNKTPPPIINRLALFLGHDTTILPLLVSLSPNLWDGQWAPYAAMMIIEVSKRGLMSLEAKHVTPALV
jgi:ubiquitin-like domain-containing CTD phosphatase 1